MEKKHLLILDDDFVKFCTLNGIKDIEKYGKTIFNEAFNKIKYDGVIDNVIKNEPITKKDEIFEKKSEKSSIYDE